MKAKSQTLTQLSMKLGEQLYKTQQEAPAAGAGGEAGAAHGGDDKVVDADFTEVDESKH